MDRSASQSTAFDFYRTLPQQTKQFSLTYAFAELVDLAINSILTGREREAVGILNQLKECLQQAKNVFDGRPEMLVNHVMTVKVLQLENCQLRLELARFSGNEDEIFICEEELKQFDLYITSATANLGG